MPLVGDLSSILVRRGGDLHLHELLTVAGKTPLSPLEEALRYWNFLTKADHVAQSLVVVIAANQSLASHCHSASIGVGCRYIISILSKGKAR